MKSIRHIAMFTAVVLPLLSIPQAANASEFIVGKYTGAESPLTTCARVGATFITVDAQGWIHCFGCPTGYAPRNSSVGEFAMAAKD